MKSLTRGSVLILVLWVLMILSIFAFSIGYTVRQRLRLLEHLEVREKLRAIAEAGVKKALYVLNQKEKKEPFSDSLNELWSRNESAFRDIPVGEGSFSVTSGADETYGLTDEERKININGTASPLVLTKLFQHAAGLPEEEARAVALSIMDWRDEDDNPYDGGAESRYYRSLSPPYAPKNADFSTLEELLYVKGITPEIFEKVRPYLTLDGNTRINIQTASRVVLLSLGFSDFLADAVLSFRAGRDGEERTGDDGVFQDTGSVIEVLDNYRALGDNESKSLEAFIQSGMVGVDSQNFMIESVARLSHRSSSLTVRCVAERYGRVKRWSEEWKAA